MTQQVINNASDDPPGSFTKCNSNFTEIYDSLPVSAWTDLSGSTDLSVSTAYHDSLSAPRSLNFIGTPDEGDFIALTLDVTTASTLTFPSSERSGTDGTTTSLDLQLGRNNFLWKYTNSVWILQDTAPAITTDYLSGVFEEGADDDTTVILNSPVAMTIVNTTTQSDSGTGTYTFKIDTTALGGTANSVSSTEQEQAHASANDVAVGDNVVITRSADSTCVKGAWLIKYTREV